MLPRTQVALFLIMLTALFFRFWNLANVPPGLYPDEAMNGSNALESIETGNWKVFYPENNGREGLFINIQAGFVAALGAKPWALRLPSAIFGTLTVLGIFFLARFIFWEWAWRDNLALLASFFAATSFWHINFSRIGFRAITAPFFLVWSLYFLFRLYKNAGSNFSQTLSAVLGGILFGLGFHSYIAYRVMSLLLLIPLVQGWRSYKSDHADPEYRSCFPCLAALFIFFAFIAFLPLGLYFLNHPADFLGRTSQISIFSTASPLKTLAKNALLTARMFWFQGDNNWRHNFAGAPQLFWPVGLCFFVGILAALKNILKKTDREKRRASWFLASWLILALAPVAISSEGLPHALRAIIAIPPVMILAGWGGVGILTQIKKWLEREIANYPDYLAQLKRVQKELVLLLAAVLITISSHAFNQYFFRWAGEPDVYFAFAANYKELADYLNFLPQELPKYVVINAPGVLVRGIPMPSQTIMFLTRTFLPQDQHNKNIFYVTPEKIPYGEMKNKEKILVAMLEPDFKLRADLNKNIPNLETKIVAKTIYLVK
ncbi:MAG: glycosyltransferase family 39 protein [bacterium]|nr:glycosyltransferase family 39 protein [bacterium]